MKRQNKSLIRWMFVALLVWNALIILAPISGQLSWRPMQYLSGAIYFFLDPVCHQLPQRSLFFQHLPFAVCARCFSIYLSGLLVFASALGQRSVYPWPYRRYLVLATLVLSGIALEKFGILPDWNEIRFANGLLAGLFLFRLLLESFLLTEQKKIVADTEANVMRRN